MAIIYSLLVENETSAKIIIFFSIILIAVIYKSIRVNKIKRNIHHLNVVLGAPFIPKLTRELTTDEKSKLTVINYLKNNTNFGKNTLVITVYYLCFLIIFAYKIGSLYGFMLLLAHIIIVGWYFARVKEKNYLDKISPVYQLTGPLEFISIDNRITKPTQKNLGTLTGFLVADKKFRVKIGSLLYYQVAEFKRDDLVTIEYTNFNNIILNIKKHTKKS